MRKAASRFSRADRAEPTQPRSVRLAVVADRIAVPEHHAPIGAAEAREDSEQRGLAAAVAPGEPQRTTRRERERESVEYRSAAASGGEVHHVEPVIPRHDASIAFNRPAGHDT